MQVYSQVLKSGSWGDLFASIKWHNIIPLVAVGLSNFALVRYLVGEVFASRARKLQALWDFYPGADPDEWYEQTAGQRVQVIKPDPQKGGVLQFGTEVITSADGSMSGLLGGFPWCLHRRTHHVECFGTLLPSEDGGVDTKNS